MSTNSPATSGLLPTPHLNLLMQTLRDRGYQVVGPTIQQNAIVYDEVHSVDDLPRGWTDEHGPGSYRLKKREDDACFGYVVGPHSWKQFLFPPVALVATSDRGDTGWKFAARTEDPPPRCAFLGVRACEIAAMRTQDRVFQDGPFIDPIYAGRRTAAFIVAVNCTQAAPTCFCTSMNTGPECRSGFDIAVTEIGDGWVLESGSEAGAEVMQQLPLTEVMPAQNAAATAARQQARDQISRRLNTDDIRDLLLSNLNHAHWDDVAERCLSCSNCTMVCPTCFCSTVEDVADLSGDHVDRRRQWDSCFNVGFSYLNGGVARNSIRSRYRQWLTHKLASWIDQFGESGCVGCGRCITWCPTGIDLTQEVAAIRATDGRAVLNTSAAEAAT